MLSHVPVIYSFLWSDDVSLCGWTFCGVRAAPPLGRRVWRLSVFNSEGPPACFLPGVAAPLCVPSSGAYGLQLLRPHQRLWSILGVYGGTLWF